MRSRLARLFPPLLAMALPLGARVAPQAARLGGRLGAGETSLLTVLGGGAVVGAAALRACAKAGKAGGAADDAVRAGSHADDAVRAGSHTADDAAKHGDDLKAPPAASVEEGGTVGDHVAQEGAQRAAEQAVTATEDEEE